MITALLFAVALLIVGLCLRVWMRPLQWIYVPASIVGGVCGLLIVQTGLGLLPESPGADWPVWLTVGFVDEVAVELRTWPGWLIAVVFAGMFLERQSRSLQQSVRLAGREGLVVWIIVLGQTAIGLLVTWLLIQPFFDVPNSFGMLIETGFAGGHGTAGAMGEVFQSPAVDLKNGRDLGIFMATVGLVFSVISGVVYVNIAIRRGWTRVATDRLKYVTGLEDRDNPPPVAWGTIRPDVLDPLVFQLLILASAVGIGMALQQGVSSLAGYADGLVADGTNGASDRGREAVTDVLTGSTSLTSVLGSFPLFIYTLFGGLIVRRAMEVAGTGDLIDPGSIRRLTGAAMEFLVVSAIASLSIAAISEMLLPLLLLIVAAFVWTGFCLLHVARKLLPQDYWFELGIINYGMSTGTTATGLVLLRIVDEHLESGAAEDYALAAPLSAPFIGGGMLTLAWPMLVLERIPIFIPAIGISLLVVMLYLWGVSTVDRVK